MKENNMLKKTAIVVFLLAIGLFGYMLYISKAFSYLSSDPKACVNCHVMNTQYATWKHSSHAREATCIECHLPTDGFVNKYIAKAKDGWNHSVAFTLNTYDHSMKISDDGAKRVQANCISCHKSLTSSMSTSVDMYHNFSDENVENGRKCWSCHKQVPHGSVRSITTTPHQIGVTDLKR